MKRIIIIGIGIVAVFMIGVYNVYVGTLPKLDPTGRNPSDEAFLAMIQGKPVYDLGSGRILTRKDYEAEKPK